MNDHQPKATMNWKYLFPVAIVVVLIVGAYWLKIRTKPPATNITKRETSATESTLALLQRGMREHNAGAYDAAMDLYHKVLQREPGNASAHYNLGQIFNAREEYAKAQWELLSRKQ